MKERRLRLLFVRPEISGPSGGGDAVVHDAVADRLSMLMDVKVVPLQTVSGPARYLNLWRCGPPEVARHMSSKNRTILQDAVRDFSPDVICLNHEFCFPLVADAVATGAEVVLYPHNVHSQILDTDRSLASHIFRGATRRFERRFYGHPGVELICISRSDARYLRERGVRGSTVIAPPGAPPDVPLAQQARVEATLVITGSYGWWRKLRDLRRFAADPHDVRVPCFVSDAVESAVQVPGSSSTSDLDWGAAIRFGVLTDRFVGGFKLKSTEYVAKNCVIISFADIYEEFEGLPHAAEFVRTVGSRREAEAIALDMAARSDEIALRFAEFKAACLEHFDWGRTLDQFDSAIRGAGRADDTSSEVSTAFAAAIARDRSAFRPIEIHAHGFGWLAKAIGRHCP